jgi:hypothetical protein
LERPWEIVGYVAAGTELRLPITEKACYRKDREGDAKGAKKLKFTTKDTKAHEVIGNRMRRGSH